MVQIAIGFTVGILLFQHQSQIPSLFWLLTGVLALWAGFRFPATRLLQALVLGFCWAHWYAWITQPAELSGQMLNRDVWLTGTIQNIPDRTLDRIRFVFAADSLELHGRKVRGHWRFRLNWYDDAPDLWAGDQWRLPVRLKEAHGMANPGGFDYQGWLYMQGIRYTGYVRGEGAQKLGQEAGLNRIRQGITRKLDQEGSRAHGVMRALVVGDRTGFEPVDRDLFAKTGTSHLVAISGLHIGLVAGLVYLLVQSLWRWIPRLCLRVPAKVAAAPAAMLAALGYSALAGFSIPTQRALIMLLVVMTGLMFRRQVSAWNTLSLALLAVLAWYPVSVLSAGFWLSFVAVAVILYAMISLPEKHRWLYLQIAVGLGLAPILLVFQMNPSLLAPLVNSIAIPLFSFVLIPLLMLSTLLAYLWPGVGHALLQASAAVIDQGLLALSWLVEHVPGYVFIGAKGWQVLVPGLAGAALLLAPRGIPGRYLGLLMLLPILYPPRPDPVEDGGFFFTLLDVGQGMAAVVETRNHVLVFDTGPRFRSGFETGSAVVVPFLYSRMINQVDTLVLSHGDSDHVGGAHGLANSVKVKKLLSGEPIGLKGLEQEPCLAGDRWTWDGVTFEVLFPFLPGGEGNNASCVMRISNGRDSLLLAGDIEARAEQKLVDHYGKSLRSTMVVAPHHGSNSSSSPGFVQMTRPAYVLFPAGYKNRWGFPAEAVIKRWQDAGSAPLDTGRAGAIISRFSRDGLLEPTAYRESHRRYWY